MATNQNSTGLRSEERNASLRKAVNDASARLHNLPAAEVEAAAMNGLPS